MLFGMANSFYLNEYLSLPKTPVTSTNVASVAYAPDFHRLYIAFKGAPFPSRGTGKGYVYFHVPPEVYQALLAAPSKGTFVWQVIRNYGKDDAYGFDRLWG